MSDHVERQCTNCGSLLHHEDDCRDIQYGNDCQDSEIQADVDQMLTTLRRNGLLWSTGIIRRYFQDKAYGFIRPDNNGLDVWVHKKFCAKDYTPVEGDKVVYLTRLGDGGSLVAKEVQFESNMSGLDMGVESGDRSIFNQPIIQNSLDTIEDTPKLYEALYGKRS